MKSFQEVFEVGDALSDGLYLSDKNGFVISVNNSYTRLTGIEAAEAVGKHMQTVLNKKYENGEYVVLKIEHLKDGKNISTTGNEEPYITERPAAI